RKKRSIFLKAATRSLLTVSSTSQWFSPIWGRRLSPRLRPASRNSGKIRDGQDGGRNLSTWASFRGPTPNLQTVCVNAVSIFLTCAEVKFPRGAGYGDQPAV